MKKAAVKVSSQERNERVPLCSNPLCTMYVVEEATSTEKDPAMPTPHASNDDEKGRERCGLMTKNSAVKISGRCERISYVGTSCA